MHFINLFQHWSDGGVYDNLIGVIRRCRFAFSNTSRTGHDIRVGGLINDPSSWILLTYLLQKVEVSSNFPPATIFN